MKNLTSNPIVVQLPKDADGNYYEFTIPVDPKGPASVKIEREDFGDIAVSGPDGEMHIIPRIREYTEKITGWTREDGPAIVSRVVLAAAPSDAPLYAPLVERVIQKDENQFLVVRSLITTRD